MWVFLVSKFIFFPSPYQSSEVVRVVTLCMCGEPREGIALGGWNNKMWYH